MEPVVVPEHQRAAADGGDLARWVQVVAGGAAGWQIGWQALPGRGAWIVENLWSPETAHTAISLVPPLAVVGLALESGSVIQALGALLLFLTNFVAIIGTGIVVMSIYGVNRLARVDSAGKPRRLARPVALLAVMLVIIGAPLAYTSLTVAARSIVEKGVFDTSERWAQSVGWEVQDVTTQGEKVHVRLEGPLPLPQTSELKSALDAAGVDTSLVIVNLVPIYTVDFDAIE